LVVNCNPSSSDGLHQTKELNSTRPPKLLVRKAFVALNCTKAGRKSISLRTFAEEDLKFLRVVKLSESDKDSVSEARGFEEIDVLVEAVEMAYSMCQLSTYQISSD
jgi:hypothetical protein